jgi:hypothetical protein
MNLQDKLTEYLEASEESVMLYDEYEDAFIGLGYKQFRGPVAVYDASKCIDILVDQFKEDPDLEDETDVLEMAVEYFDYNTMGAWYGEDTPIFVTATLEEIESNIGE